MNAHNEQHDPASAVVKQNLTTQPAAAQEAVAPERVAWARNGATGSTIIPMPGLHKLPHGDYDLFAAPVTAAPAVDVETLRALSDRWANDRSYTGSPVDDIRALIEQPTKSTPAAPGIDMGVPGATLTIDGETFTVDEVRLVLAGALADAKRLDFLIRTYSHLRMRNGAWVVAVGGETPAPGEGYPTACAAIDAAMQTQPGDVEVQNG